MSKNNHYNTEQYAEINSVKDDEEKLAVQKSAISFLERSPKRSFIWMIAILIISILLNVLYSVFVVPEEIDMVKAIDKAQLSVDPITQGLGRIIQVSSSLNETIAIKEKINDLMNNDTLSNQDSVKLLVMFEQLEQINKKLLPTKKP